MAERQHFRVTIERIEDGLQRELVSSTSTSMSAALVFALKKFGDDGDVIADLADAIGEFGDMFGIDGPDSYVELCDLARSISKENKA